MIYKEITPRETGTIVINDRIKTFKIKDYSVEWATIQIIEKGLVTEVHSVPTNAPLNTVFRTGGNDYKVMIRPEIVRY